MKVSLTASSLMAVGGLLVGLVIASPSATMADPNDEPTTQSTPTPTESATPTQTPTPEQTSQPQAPNSGGAVKAPAPGHIEIKWQEDSLSANWEGSCESKIEIKVGPADWGKLPEPKNGIQALGGTSFGPICEPGNGGSGVSVSLSEAVCYGFTQAWVQVDGKTEDAGLKVLEIPKSITCNH